MDSFGLAETESIVIAFAFGAALVFLVGKLLSKARGLESSGTLNVQNAVGKTGIVYFDIPAGGRGQVRLEVQGRMVTLNAKSSGETIETGATVRVDGVDGSDTLIVVAES